MKTLLSETEVRRGVGDLAERIRADLGTGPITVVGVLTGSVILVADLIRQFDQPVHVAFVEARSYQGTQRRELSIRVDDRLDLSRRDVLLVDDIFDSGKTLEKLVADLSGRGPRTLRTAVLMTKRDQAEVKVVPNFSAFTIPNQFVVGYGLDYQGMYRNLPYIGVLEEADL